MVDNNIMKERLNRAFTETRVDNVELAEFCSVTEQAVSKWRKTGGISKQNISKVTQFFKKPENWLTAEKEPVGTPDFLVSISYYRTQANTESGDGNAIAEDESDNYADTIEHDLKLLSFNQNWIMQRKFNATSLYLIEIDDDSMVPRMHHGDVVVINTDDKEINSGKIYAIAYANNNVKIKMLKMDHKGNLIIHSVNKMHGDELVSKKDISSLVIVGRAVWVASEL